MQDRHSVFETVKRPEPLGELVLIEINFERLLLLVLLRLFSRERGKCKLLWQVAIGLSNKDKASRVVIP